MNQIFLSIICIEEIFFIFRKLLSTNTYSNVFIDNKFQRKEMNEKASNSNNTFRLRNLAIY